MISNIQMPRLILVLLFIAHECIAISIIVFYLQVLRKSSGKLQICVKISVCKRFSSKIIFLLRKFIIPLQRVFHGIRFKVRGLVVVRQLIFFFCALPEPIHMPYPSPPTSGHSNQNRPRYIDRPHPTIDRVPEREGNPLRGSC